MNEQTHSAFASNRKDEISHCSWVAEFSFGMRLTRKRVGILQVTFLFGAFDYFRTRYRALSCVNK